MPERNAGNMAQEPTLFTVLAVDKDASQILLMLRLSRK